jgi:alpha-mannosidase
MPLRRASLILPGHHLEDFPTHFVGDRAAELLSAWTALWHPAILAATGAPPAWHPADTPPEPETLEGELIIVPPVSRERLPSDWCDRFAATQPRNPPLIEPFADRGQTIAAALAAASIEPQPSLADSDVAGDFLALGYAYLQVELLTRAMRYTTLLDANLFDSAVIDGARAAINGQAETARDALGRAFDLLRDARSHFYSVDFFLIDVTLLASTTLGEPLRAKLASGSPTSLLAPAELIEQMADHQPDSLAQLRHAMEAGTACVIGGRLKATPAGYQSPESLLAELNAAQAVYERHLGCGVEVFAQYDSPLSMLLPELLSGLGFRAALHASFDGGNLPLAEQPKTWWSAPDGSRIEALSTMPLDAAQPETWLALADRVGESLSHDHVATLLMAGWPKHSSEFADDVRRAARYSSVLGKLVTLDEYFRTSREIDDWITFQPREYPSSNFTEPPANLLSSKVDEYRREVAQMHGKLVAGLAAAVPLGDDDPAAAPEARVVLNGWNFARSQLSTGGMQNSFIADIPGCGFAALATAATAPPAPLVVGRTLRNERLEVVISETSGGIQSLRGHSNRSTRASQRLVFCDRHTSSRAYRIRDDDKTPEADVRMLADEIEITTNDVAAGEFTARGRLVDANDGLLARFTQTTCLPRGQSAVLVDVTLDLERPPDGAPRNSYFASRLVWRGDALGVRRGIDWTGRTTSREWIESPEWVEIDDGVGRITCFALGLPLHRLASSTRLDTLLAVAGRARQRFQLAIGLDCPYATQSALALLTSGQPAIVKALVGPSPPRGWFLHATARNVVVTHIAPLIAPRSGLAIRLLETEGRDAQVALAAFRPIRAAQFSDFRGQPSELISVDGGAAHFDIGSHHWVQVQVEF